MKNLRLLQYDLFGWPSKWVWVNRLFGFYRLERKFYAQHEWLRVRRANGLQSW